MEPGFTIDDLLQLPGPTAEEESGCICYMYLFASDQSGINTTYIGKSTAIFGCGIRINRHLKSLTQPFAELKSFYDRLQQPIPFHCRFSYGERLRPDFVILAYTPPGDNYDKWFMNFTETIMIAFLRSFDTYGNDTTFENQDRIYRAIVNSESTDRIRGDTVGLNRSISLESPEWGFEVYTGKSVVGPRVRSEGRQAPKGSSCGDYKCVVCETTLPGGAGKWLSDPRPKEFNDEIGKLCNDCHPKLLLAILETKGCAICKTSKTLGHSHWHYPSGTRIPGTNTIYHTCHVDSQAALDKQRRTALVTACCANCNEQLQMEESKWKRPLGGKPGKRNPSRFCPPCWAKLYSAAAKVRNKKYKQKRRQKSGGNSAKRQ